MFEKQPWSSGWRGTVLIALGVLIGASFISPAVAHVGGTLNHLWNSPGHIKAKVKAYGDPRWVNGNEPAGGDLTGPHGNLQIAGSAVGTPEIGGSAVVSAHIATDTLLASDIHADAVTSDEIAANAIGASEVSLVMGTTVSVVIPGGAEGNGDANTDTVIATCFPSTQEIIGVSVDWTPNLPTADDELYIVESRRLGSTQWIVWGGNDTDANATLEVTPLCLA